MSPRRHNRMFSKNVTDDLNVRAQVPEKLRIDIDQQLKDFLANPDVTEYIFTSDLNNLQRKYIHDRARYFNLFTKSSGKGSERSLHVRKLSKPVNVQSFELKPCEVSSRALKELDQSVLHEKILTGSNGRPKTINDKIFTRLTSWPPCLVMPSTYSQEMIDFKSSLPVYGMRYSILEDIQKNQVVIISAETGSGKTTQIPQYIMDYMMHLNKPCKIICTQPRRLSAVSVAARVAEERSEELGNSVGYHIRLDQHYSNKTNLIYCTNGVLLRTLMSSPESMKEITHLIIDEIHERDCLSDFLLICIRKVLSFTPELRVILMSATINIKKFDSYFGATKVLSIPGRLFSIQEYFLEDILENLSYKTKDMLALAELNQNRVHKIDNGMRKTVFEGAFMDAALEEYMMSDGNFLKSRLQLEVYIESEDVSVNYQHSESGKTILMIAAALGDVETIKYMYSLGANLKIRCNLGKTCYDYAIESQQPMAVQVLEALGEVHLQALQVFEGLGNGQYDHQSSTSPPEKKSEDMDLLTLYDCTHSLEQIDFDLAFEIIKKIHQLEQEGAILVFLPGYDEIMIMNDIIVNSRELPEDTYRVFLLHGSISIASQRDVFKKLYNRRKIVLSTNIAETSVTIDDVVFVIDSGKAKEKSYDSYNKSSMLQVHWISKACAKQRAGRAGRTKPGKCFYLYSRQRYENLEEERVPEILRMSLDELCLHTKILAPKNMDIASFLQQALDPPANSVVQASIENLITLGALDAQENLTPLGEYLAQLSIAPHLGKMLILASIFRCLDPFLSLIAVLAHKDPFQLPSNITKRAAVVERRKSIADGILSDHFILLKVFQMYQHSCGNGRTMAFCRDFCISPSGMEMILDIRRQLLGQLRACNFVPRSNSLDEVNVLSNSWPMIKAIMCSGLYPQIGYPVKSYFSTRNDKKVGIHSSSVLKKTDVQTWVMYDEMMKISNGLFLKGVSAITPISVVLMAGNNYTVPCPNNIIIDEWLDFEFDDDSLIRLRNLVQAIVSQTLGNPDNHYKNPHFKKVLTILNTILVAEDIEINLKQASCIGSNPRFPFKQPSNNYNPRPRSHNYQSDNWRQSPVKAPQFNPQLNHGQNWRKASPNRNFQQTSWRSSEVTQEARAHVPVVQEASNSEDLTQMTRLLKLEDRFNSYEYQDNTIYLLIRAQCLRNIRISFTSSQWILSPQTEKKIISLSRRNKQIVLVFTIKKENSIGGIAEFKNMLSTDVGKPTAILLWKKHHQLEHYRVRHLKNPYYNNAAIFQGPDGQVIERSVAQELIRIYDELQS